VLAFLILVHIFLIFPSGRRKKTAQFFASQTKFAHRGLHGEGVPENSLAAFELACKNGYGIELDVHVTADDKLVVFHDDTLKRMCGIDEKTENKTLPELQALALDGTEEHIPSFREVLDLVDGRDIDPYTNFIFTLSAYYDMPHGKACATLLPTVMEFNAPATGEKYKDIAIAMGVQGVDKMTQDEYRKAAVDAVKKLAEDVGIDCSLKGVVKEEDVDALAQDAFNDACRPGNPREVSVEEIKELYRSLM
jgi:hypothetical protein